MVAPGWGGAGAQQMPWRCSSCEQHKLQHVRRQEPPWAGAGWKSPKVAWGKHLDGEPLLESRQTFLGERNAGAGEGLGVTSGSAPCFWCFCPSDTEVLLVALTAVADRPSRLQESIQVSPALSPDGGWCGKTLPGRGSWPGEGAGCLKRGGGEKGCAGTLYRAAGGFAGQEWGWDMFSFCWWPQSPTCHSSCGHHLQEMLQSLPGIFLASCLGLGRNPMKSAPAAGEEDAEVQRDG